MSKKIDYEEIRQAEFYLDQLRGRFLRQAGWKRICQTVGSYWLWEKTINERVYLLDTTYAINVENQL